MTAAASADILRAFDMQARACALQGSPFSAGILAAAGEDAAAGGPVAELTAPWAQRDFKALLADAMALRLLGALHALVLSGAAPRLAALYPAAGGRDPQAAWMEARPLLGSHRREIAEFMTHEPQTNEVRRSAVLLPGFLTIAAETGLPLRCFELGASGGLNQLWDRYRYTLGEASWGDPASPLHLDTEWKGKPPPVEAPLRVLGRAACDRRPVRLEDPAERLRLAAYIWADQPERIRRLETAVAMALEADVAVEALDAAAFAARVTPEPGAATVIYHSIFWQYMPAQAQAATGAAIARAAAEASAAAPFAWLRMEPDPVRPQDFQLRLTLWPDGETRVLATVQPHGAWVEWRG